MKKLLIMLMALCLSFGAFGFVACNDNGDDITPPANEQTDGDNAQNGDTTDGDNAQNGDTTDGDNAQESENGDATEDNQEPTITGRPGELPILPV
ncbi:MAG: hypothetical protein IJ329_00135 [Clostridia bacterium]|nr:hypothetical protein [Clostridia bacterium]